MAKNYIEFVFNDTLITSLQNWINQPDSLIKDYQNSSARDFLQEVGENGKTNLQRIWESYTFEEQEAQQTNYNGGQGQLDLIKPGIKFVIPKSRVNSETISIIGKNQFLTQATFEAFWSARLEELRNDINYSPIEIPEINSGVKSQTTNCRVWIWIRALDRIIDVSSFVTRLSTFVDGQSNNFNLQLLPFTSFGDIDFIGQESFVNFNLRGQDGKENIPFFAKFLQQNDLVFIRFETLKLEQSNDIENRNPLEIGASDVPNKVYDMIGLIDIPRETTTQQNNSSIVSVSGRDFLKLLQEDGNWFFPLRWMENSETFFAATQDEENGWFRRNMVTGEYNYLFFYNYRNIQDTLGFILNQLVNLGVIGDRRGPFSNYPDDRVTKRYEISQDDSNYLEEVEAKGVWRIIEFAVDNSSLNRVVSDSSFSQPDGTILQQFNKICQPPFVEFFGDTYGDKYEFIVRQPPFTQKDILQYLESENGVITIDDYFDKDLNYDERFFSWYQLEAQQSIIGTTGQVALAYLPIVYFPQYAEVFGNHRLSVVSNYIPRSSILGDKQTINQDLFREAIVEDFSYLIESNCYLPFTRTGTITLYGDRRIKKGTFIRFSPTGEIFYVSSVRNDLVAGRGSVSRTTTIEVSRGMVEKFIRIASVSDQPSDVSISNLGGTTMTGGTFNINVNATTPKFSYFNIIDTNLIRSTLINRFESSNANSNQQTVRERRATKTNFGVNEEVFNFFLQRRQFV